MLSRSKILYYGCANSLFHVAQRAVHRLFGAVNAIAPRSRSSIDSSKLKTSGDMKMTEGKELKPRATAFRYWIGGAVVMLLFATTLTAQADVRIKDEDDFSIYIEITSTITQHDADEFQDISAKYETKLLTVYLDSRGGDVSAAMKIGRLIRKYDGWTWINSKCYSSCALIFIAGVIRTTAPYGELGLHRPYLASTPANRESVEKQVPIMLSTIKNYINEMGITDNFYQQMVNTEPSKIVVYKNDDFTKLFPEHDPVFDEVVISVEARRHGISTTEERKRVQDAKRCSTVSKGPGEAVCGQALRWGLSERIYLERNTRAKKECWFSSKEKYSEKEKESLDKTPYKLRLDHPIALRLEACTRNIMRNQ